MSTILTLPGDERQEVQISRRRLRVLLSRKWRRAEWDDVEFRFWNEESLRDKEFLAIFVSLLSVKTTTRIINHHRNNKIQRGTLTFPSVALSSVYAQDGF